MWDNVRARQHLRGCLTQHAKQIGGEFTILSG